MSGASQGTGYVLAVAENSSFYIPDAVHVERDDDLFLFADDEEAARAAERDGIQLIYGMGDVPDGVYVDTPENRAVIAAGLEKYPEYRAVAQEETPPREISPYSGLT